MKKAKVFISVLLGITGVFLIVFAISNSNQKDDKQESKKNANMHEITVNYNKSLRLNGVPVKSKDNKTMKPKSISVHDTKTNQDITDKGSIDESEKGSFISWHYDGSKKNAQKELGSSVIYKIQYSNDIIKTYHAKIEY